MRKLIAPVRQKAGRKKRIMTLEEKRIERLYKLLSRIESKDPDTAAALRWAIFELERNPSYGG